MNRILILISYCFLSSILLAQLDPATMAKLSSLSPSQKQNLMSSQGAKQSSSDFSPTASIPNRVLEVEKPSEDSFTDRSSFLGELNGMERIVLADITRLEQQLSEENTSEDNELVEALEESRSLIRKIKELQRREIEKRAEEFGKSGTDAIKPFGYELFASASSTFAPGNEVPIPSDYRVGPGDLIEIQLFGQQNQSFSLVISREGIIRFPGIGPVNAFEMGTSFVELKNHLKVKILEHLGEGVQSSITLGAFRSIRIFLLGEVRSQGAYTVSALSTLVNALLVSGGINETGSLRNIQLKRDGQIVTTLDLYDLLLKGDTSADSPLQPGDVIFVPVIEKQVSISGSVRRPAKYEMIGGETLKDLITLAGGTKERAFLENIRLERLGADFRPLVKNLNIPQDLSFKLFSGDIVSISSSGVKVTNSISLVGNIERPGEYEWRDGICIRDLVQGQESLLPRTDLNYGLIRRKNTDGTIKVLSFAPSSIFKDVDSSDNHLLNKKDIIYFFPSDEPRQKLLDELLSDLRRQGRPGIGTPLVMVSGLVRFPGEYPLIDDMHFFDLINASGGLTDASYTLSAELTKFSVNNDQNAKVKHIQLLDFANKDNNLSKSIRLEPYDHLTIKKIPFWGDSMHVEILGEFTFPGKYRIYQGESLNDVIKRAGGLTKNAFFDGAIFTREHIRKKEESQRNDQINRLENSITYENLEKSDDSSLESLEAIALINRLKSIESIGRLVIDLESQLTHGHARAILTLKGDRLFVPSRPQEVTVTGEVRFPSSHLHDKSLSKTDYIDRSGGLTERSDKKQILVVKSNGMVVSKTNNRWFSNQTMSFSLEPGDTIFVPVKIELPNKFMENLSLSTQIIFQLALAAAAVNSF